MTSLLATQDVDFDPASNVRFTDIDSTVSQEKILPLLGAGSLSGDVTAQRFRENAQLAKFMQRFSDMKFEDLQEVPQDNGDTWHVGMQTIDGEDYHIHISEYELLASLNLSEVTDTTIAEHAKKFDIKPESTYVEIDGKRYFVKMSIPLNFGSNGSSKVLINAGVFLVGDGIATSIVAGIIRNTAGKAIGEAFKQASKSMIQVAMAVIKGTVTAAWSFLKTVVQGIFRGEFSGLLARATEAAGTAWRAAFAALESTEVLLGAVGVLLAIAAALSIKYIMHSSRQNLYIYNLTDKDLTFSIPYTSHGKVSHDCSPVLKAYKDRGMYGKWYNACQLRADSRSDVTGIGYAIGLNLLDPATQNEVANFSCMFDVPFKGDNSLNVKAGKESDIEEFYNQNEGVNTTGQAVASDSAFEIIATYDIVSGEQKDLVTGDMAYLYNSLLIVRNKTVA
jgi:hypothetical protein